jgi:phage terminase large subunit-like protein
MVAQPTLAQEIARRTIARFTSGSSHKESCQPQRAIQPLVDWIQSNFYLYDTGELMSLYPCQLVPLTEAMQMDEAGRYKYNTVLWSWPKKSAKSSIVAAVVDWKCSNYPRSLVRLVANDLKQADSRVGHYLRESIKFSAKDNPERAAIKIKPSGYLIEYPNGSRVEMVPIDPTGEAGGNDDLIVYSELHGWKSKAHQDMWAEMTLSPNKFSRSQRWIDTYAGFEGESPILENLYQVGKKQGRELFEEGSEVYANDAARLLCVWITRHLLPWQTNEDGRAYYAQEAASLHPNQYRRMHKNQWVSSLEAFVQPEWWGACKGETPEFDAKTPVVVGMDAGVSNDCFALVGVSRIGEQTYVRFSRVWKPPQGGSIDFSGENGPETVIRDELTKNYNIVQICYDAYQLHDMSTRLRRDGVAWLYEFKQGEPRLEADKQLHDVIRDKRITHGGQADLSDHVKNANAEINKEDRRLRIVKRAEHLKVDACVALSMANFEARRLNL